MKDDTTILTSGKSVELDKTVSMNGNKKHRPIKDKSKKRPNKKRRRKITNYYWKKSQC